MEDEPVFSNLDQPFSKWSPANFVAGTSRIPSNGIAMDAERKSPPLDAFHGELSGRRRVSPNAYFDPAMIAVERDRLWAKTWLCAGRTSDLARTGDWLRFDMAGESFVISRSDNGGIVAFYNVCQHRANRLVDEDFGNARQFMCPYHGWRYDGSGRCIHVTDRPFFQPEALAGSLDIPQVRCDTFGGFVFITLDQQAPPLGEYLGEISDIVAGYRLERMEVRSDVDLDLACNWKVILDAFSEVYHAHITHPATSAIIEDRYNQMDFYAGGHSRRIVPVGEPSVRRGPSDAVNPTQQAVMQEAGIDPTTFSGSAHEVRRALQIAKRAKGGIYDGLSDNQLTDNWSIDVFPNMLWSLHAEGLLVLRYMPHPTDPDACTLSMMVLAHPGVPFAAYLPDAKERTASGRPRRVRLKHTDEDLASVIGQLIYEDIRNTRETQQGMKSRGFSAIRLSDHEQVIMHQHAEMEKYLGVKLNDPN